MSNKLTMRVATHALIAGLAFTTGGVGAVTLATPAVAADNDYTPKFDAAAKGKLTIYKKADPTSIGTPNGKEDPAVTGTALGDVEFKIQQLDYDLSTLAGLKAAQKATPDEAKTHVKADGKTQTLTTDGTEGKAEFTDLPVSAYLVTEESAPAGYQKSAPFIVFIPMTDEDAAAGAANPWLYDVVAYPKNTKFNVTKELAEGDENKDANVGDDIAYVVKGDRPAVNKAEKYVSFYELIDIAPAGLKYKSVEVKIGDTALTKDTDFKVVQEDGKVKARLTNDGLQKLLDADPAVKVEGTFTFTVESVGGNAFTANNEGSAQFNTKKYPTTPTDPDNPKVPGDNDPDVPGENPETPGENPGVEETWVPVIIKKQGATDADKLNGAEFNVYRCVATSEDAATGTTVGDKLTVGGKETFTTAGDGDNKGQVKIDALRLRKERRSDGNTWDGYCLVETKAPAGYELSPEPKFFRLPGETKNPVKLDLPVENVPSVGPKLPGTGGMGVGILVVIGALIAGTGVFFARRNSSAKA